MQHDPLSSEAKILSLPQEIEGYDPTAPENARPTTSPNELEDDDADDSENANDAESIQHHMRGRFFREADHSAFLEWIHTEIPLELEIGSGKGLFLTNASARAPNRRFVGLELAAKYALDCQSRVEKTGIPNAKFFACDAVAVLDQDVADGSLDAIHVYFPDPWWKSRHKKRRVLNEKSLCNIERTLKPTGSLHFWTDVLDYYELICGQVMDTTSLLGPKFIAERQASHGMDYTTHFERRARLNGQPIYRALFVKPI